MRLVLFLLGAAFASFVICQAERSEPLNWRQRSSCNHCNHPLNFIQLFPLLGYGLQTGRCQYCHKKIPPLYPLLELLSGIYFVWIHSLALWQPHLFTWICISVLLLYLSLYDIILLEVPTGGLIILLLVSLYQGIYLQFNLLPACFIYIMLELWILFRPNTLGGADSKLLSILCLTLPDTSYPLFFCLTGCLGLIGSFLRPKNKWDQPLPFIPYIHLAYILLLTFL